jgi:hypothetical protein
MQPMDWLDEQVLRRPEHACPCWEVEKFGILAKSWQIPFDLLLMGVER